MNCIWHVLPCRRYFTFARVIKAEEDDCFHICAREKVSMSLVYQNDCFQLLVHCLSRRCLTCMSFTVPGTVSIVKPTSTRLREQLSKCQKWEWYPDAKIIIVFTLYRIKHALGEADAFIRLPDEEGYVPIGFFKMTWFDRLTWQEGYSENVWGSWWHVCLHSPHRQCVAYH